MCTDPDLVVHSVLHDQISDFLHDETLLENAFDKYWKMDLARVRTPMHHITVTSYNLLFEATIAYCLGIYRSSIFCCCTLLDMELKNAIRRIDPDFLPKLRNQTFGQSISYVKDNHYPEKLADIIENLRYINDIRNEIIIHSYKRFPVLGIFESEEKFDDYSYLRSYFSETEILEIEKEESQSEIDWLERLTYKLVIMTKELIPEFYI